MKIVPRPARLLMNIPAAALLPAVRASTDRGSLLARAVGSSRVSNPPDAPRTPDTTFPDSIRSEAGKCAVVNSASMRRVSVVGVC